jgi:general secretion pathway protein G
MSSPATPPPLPNDPPPAQPPSSGQWSHTADTSGEPKKSKVWLWIVLGAGGCLASILVLGLAATLLVPYLSRKVESAKRARVQAHLHDLHAALDVYAETHGQQYPDSLEALVRPDPHGHTLLRDERELPRDPWGHEFVYEPPAPEHREPVLYSLGRDGRPGGDGIDADVHEDPQPAEDR